MGFKMRKQLLTLGIAVALFVSVSSTGAFAATFNLGFEGQPFFTETWTENGASWAIDGGDIRSYNGLTHSGTCAAIVHGGQGINCHAGRVTFNSLWVRPDDMPECDKSLSVFGYRGGQKVATKVVDFDFVFAFVQIALDSSWADLDSIAVFQDSPTWGACLVAVDDVSYTAEVSLKYSAKTFKEAYADVGAIDNKTPAVLTLAHETLTGADGDDFVAAGKVVVANLPAGLTAKLLRKSAYTLALTLEGSATAHAMAQSVTNLTLTFQNAAFVGGVASAVSGYQTSDLAVQFHGPVDSLIKVTSEAEGGNCAKGGQRVDTGVDNGDGDGTLGNGTLEEGEIDNTFYVCNGATGATGETGAPGNDGAPGQDGTNGTDGADGHNSLTDIFAANEADCPAGGVNIEVGLDNGDGGETADDGLLGPGELDDAFMICHGLPGQDGADGADGADGHNSLLLITDEPEGDNCPTAGKKIESGLDLNDNDALDPEEVNATQYLCNGLNGADGADGQDGEVGPAGHNALSLISDEAPGDLCPAGGKRLDVGIDLNDSGVLDEDEIQATDYLCNGEEGAQGPAGNDGAQGPAGDDGAQGPAGNDGTNGNDGAQGANGDDGNNALVKILPEPAGENCEFGGLLVQAGLDQDGDAALSDLEVSSANFLCNGEAGDEGPEGDRGGSGSCSAAPTASTPAPGLLLLALALLLAVLRQRKARAL
jgi:MYXO-CTERM domain-containing protein